MPLIAKSRGHCNQEAGEPDRESRERTGRKEYAAAFEKFTARLPAKVRAGINGSASPDWPTNRTFALAVNPESPKYRSEEPSPVATTMGELAEKFGMTEIALWVADRADLSAALTPAIAADQFRIALGRVVDAKNSRLEASLISLAFGMNLFGTYNGYDIADHFDLRPQTVHEMLTETCAALNMPKPLSKANKARYSRTQYSHKLEKAKA